MTERARLILEKLLIIRHVSGEAAAFEELVGLYQSKLRYYVRRLLDGRASEDDVLQETWLSVLGNLPGLRKTGSFAPWLYSIARNHAYRLIKRNGKYVPLADGGLQAADDTSPEFSADEAAAVHRCLGRLPVQHRDVLLLRFLEQMSYQAIAEATGLGIGTVKSRIHYAKAALRREMEVDSHDR